MTRRTLAATTLSLFFIAAVVVWQGCGGSDHNSSTSATITGNVASVNPAQAKAETRSRLLAAADLLVPRAVAQSTCAARHVLVCVASDPSQQAVCDTIDADSCRFSISFDVVNDFADGKVAFIDDANQNGRADSGEGFAFLTNPIGPICPGTVVVLNDLSIDFSTITATAASVDKAPDTCGATATPTARGTGTPTATPTQVRTNTPSGTPPTSTPTRTATALPTLTATAAAAMTQTAAATMTGTPYAYGASLNQPPSTMLAFLFGAGVFGLILPYRRRR